MALRVIARSQAAKSLDNKGDVVAGFLESVVRKKVRKWYSSIYTLVTEDGPVNVWGNKVMDDSCLVSNGKNDGSETLKPELHGVWVQCSCIGTREEKQGKGKNAKVKVYRDHEFAVDLDKRQEAGGRAYNLDKTKTYKSKK